MRAHVVETVFPNLYQWTHLYQCTVYTAITPNHRLNHGLSPVSAAYCMSTSSLWRDANSWLNFLSWLTLKACHMNVLLLNLLLNTGNDIRSHSQPFPTRQCSWWVWWGVFHSQIVYLHVVWCRTFFPFSISVSVSCTHTLQSNDFSSVDKSFKNT